jgi:hypothetical protein
MLARVSHPPLRLCTAALCLVGTSLCVLASVLAFRRVGVGSGLIYLVVGAVLVAAAIVVIRGYRWVLAGAAIVLGGQLAAVVGTAWELSTGIAELKVRELRGLGFDPTLGVTINLIYSTAAFVLFGWFVIRWWRDRGNRSDTRLKGSIGVRSPGRQQPA